MSKEIEKFEERLNETLASWPSTLAGKAKDYLAGQPTQKKINNIKSRLSDAKSDHRSAVQWLDNLQMTAKPINHMTDDSKAIELSDIGIDEALTTTTGADNKAAVSLRILKQ